MKVNQLKDFIKKHNLEYRYKPSTTDVFLFVPFGHSVSFYELITEYLNDNVATVFISSKHVNIWMNEICDYYGIELDAVFKGNE